MSSLLPDHMEEDTIKRMNVGDWGYTTPWAMYAERDRTMWINGNYTIDKSPGGTVQMLIRRMSDGVEVDLSTIRGEQYSPGGAGFLGAFTPLPVTLVDSIDTKKKSTLFDFLS